MKVLITGARGQVGSELAARAPLLGLEAVATTRAELDITDAGAIDAAIARHAPDLLINAAAYTAVDRAEEDAEACLRVNRDAPGRLARACARAGIPMFHLSTDYVFDGRLERPYTEQDAPAPINLYGRSKWEGEQRVAAGLTRHLILRVAWVFGATGTNFVKTIARLARERDELGIVADQFGSPTPADTIADTLLELALRLDHDGDLPWGTWHYAGAPDCNWYQFANAILAHLPDARARLRPITSADYPTAAARAADTRLDCTAIENALAIVRPSWKAGLDRMLCSD